MYLHFGNLKSEKSHHKVVSGIKIDLVDFGVIIFFFPISIPSSFHITDVKKPWTF